MRTRKAVSPIIAVLLLVAITVAFAIIAYSFVEGVTGTTEQAAGQIHNEALGTAGYAWPPPFTNGGTLTIYVINLGTQPTTIAEVFIDGQTNSTNGLHTTATTVQVGAIQKFTFNAASNSLTAGISPTPTLGTSHVIRFLSTDGYGSSIAVIAGHAG